MLGPQQTQAIISCARTHSRLANAFQSDEPHLERPIRDVAPDVLAWFDNSLSNTCSLTLRVDGQEVIAGGFEQMLDELHVQVSEPFKVDVNPEDSFLTPWGIPGGEMYSVGAGHYALLQALSPGDHVLELGGSICDGNAATFETSATYYLHVE